MSLKGKVCIVTGYIYIRILEPDLYRYRRILEPDQYSSNAHNGRTLICTFKPDELTFITK